jgi:hypothetical protein
MRRDGIEDDRPRSLPADGAFVVHFAPATRRRRRFEGRAEHLGSGRYTHFSSLAALLAFFAELLTAERSS